MQVQLSSRELHRIALLRTAHAPHALGDVDVARAHHAAQPLHGVGAHHLQRDAGSRAVLGGQLLQHRVQEEEARHVDVDGKGGAGRQNGLTARTLQQPAAAA